MSDAPELFIFATDPEVVASIRKRFNSEPKIAVVVGNGPQITARFGLDAVWMSVMQSTYYGVAGPLPPHVAKVFPMPVEARRKGLPRLLITGVALTEGRDYSPHYLARVRALTLAGAIAEYNLTHDAPILRVGSNPHNLGLDDLGAAEAFRAVTDAFASTELPAEARQAELNAMTA